MKWFAASLVLTLLLGAADAGAVTYYQHNFDDMSAGALSLDTYWKVMSSGGMGNTPAIRLTYSTAGTPGHQATLNMSSFNTQEFWLEFDTRIEGPMNGGMKFVKVFGSSVASQNNTTFIMDYSGNTLNRVSWYMDTLCELPLSGVTSNNSCEYTAVTTGNAIDLRGNAWHHVKIHFVRADPGVANGAYQIWIDGVDRAHFINLNNNSPVSNATDRIAFINFGDYTNSNNATWYFWIDNLNVTSTDAGGGTGATAPRAPASLTVQRLP